MKTARNIVICVATILLSVPLAYAQDVVSAPASVANTTYGTPQGPIAQWEDPQYCVVLSRTPFLNAFQLVIYSKQLNDQAEPPVPQLRSRNGSTLRRWKSLA
jgi:hypothetical protein